MESISESVSASVSVPVKQTYNVDFRATGKEYTMLVLVNIALSILTLGIFSAWAKVRTKKYLYGNTYINGSNFNYHADPLKILKGRLIIGVLFIAYAFGGRLSIVVPIAAGLIFFAATPWLFVQGMAFNMANSSYRNIRFGFDRKIKESYLMFLKGWLLTIVTLGFGMPVFVQRLMRFQVDNARYGGSHFKSRFAVADFYRIYIRFFGVYVLSFFAFGAIIMLTGIIFRDAKGLPLALAMVIGILLLYGGFLFAIAVITAGTFNLVYSKTSLESVEFETAMRSSKLFMLYLQLIGISIVTLGFGLPYGIYRIKAYSAKVISVKADPDQFDKFAAAGAAGADAAVADAANDLWDMDFGF